ncbi:TraG family conjugative transposon ATPase [Telluribacter sp.]|jgi:conjugation system TraG family ATPase|uniref:TraG family conjugative transposon ATPase n=1 Tax=Telluribacter sp. TaxID=1978767 RepID=UPI002E10962B|nr:TraG family conjugative transposon ATPase [Telluribacter sp.]
MKKIKKFEEIYPIFRIDEQSATLVSVNGDLTLAFEVVHPEIFTSSEGDIDILTEAFVSAVKTLPVGYIMHKQDWYIAQAYEPDLTTSTVRQGNFIAFDNEMHFAERPFIKHRSYIYITRPNQDSKSRASKSSRHSSLLRRHLVPKELLSQSTWDEFWDSCEQFRYLLNGSGKVTVRNLKLDELVGNVTSTGLLENYTSLSFHDRSLHELETSEDGSLQVGSKTAFTYVISELNTFPPTITNSITYEPYSSERFGIPVSTGSFLGLGLPFNHIYNQVIMIEDRDALSKRLVAEIKRHNSFSEWEKSNQVSMGYKDEYLLEMERSARVAVRAHFNVMVWDRDRDTAEAYRSSTASALSNLGFTPRLARHDASTLYWTCIPGNIAEMGKDNWFTSFMEEAVCLLALESNYNDAPFSRSGIKMTDRFGCPKMVDLFDEPLQKGAISNRNTFIVGPSGSGKSFFTNNMIYYLLTAGMHVSIVDVGHSYRRLCEVMGGRYITYDNANPISFNPFYFKNGNPREEDEDALAELLLSLWKTDNEQVTNAELTTIRDIIHNYYLSLRQERARQARIFPCFDTFYDFTRHTYPAIFSRNGGREGVEFDIKNFLYCLKPYYRDGQYGFLLNSRSNIDLMELPFIVYELDNIKDHPVLFPVTTIMIMNTYVRKLFQVKGVIKVLIIEEAWKALTKDKFANFLRWASKTVRKHDGSLVVVTQELDDLVGNEVVKDAIINNSDIKVLLDQKNYENRFSEIEGLLGLSPKQSAIVQSVNRSLDHRRPPYREACVMLKDLTKVYGIEVSPTAYAAFTTKKSEVEQIENLTSKIYKGNTERAIRAWGRGEQAEC